MNVKFLLQSKGDRAEVYVRVYQGKAIDVKAKIGVKIDAKHWRPDRADGPGVATNVGDPAVKIRNSKVNERIKNIGAEIVARWNSTPNKTLVNLAWLEAIISPERVVPEIGVPDSLVGYFDYYIKQRSAELSRQAVTKFNVVKHLVQRFEQSTGTVYKVADVNRAFRNTFLAFCKGKGYARGTTARAFKFIKGMCYEARLDGIQVSEQLTKSLTIKIKERKDDRVPKIYFTLDEIKRIEATPMPHDYLDNARDWLLISCACGQRCSDFLRFNTSMVHTDNEGDPYIEFIQKKTGEPIELHLSPRFKRVLAKRGGEFPRRISDQRYNDYIKEVCRIVGLNEKIQGGIFNPDTKRKVSGYFEKWRLVTSHIGRRTYATLNYGKVPTGLLMACTGHKHESMLLEYVGKTKSEAAKQSKKYHTADD